MRAAHSSLVLRSFRLVAVVGIGISSLQAAPAYANPPAPAPAPAPVTAPVTSTPVTTTEVATPREGVAVVVNTTTTAAPAPAASPAPAVVVTPAPAPAPAPAVVVERPPTPDPLAERRRLREVERRRAGGLAAAGWSVLGSTYLVSALIGTITLDTTRSQRMRRFGGWMTVPVVGPVGAAFNARTATGALFTTTMGLMQAAGFTMAVIGTSRHRRAKRDLRLMAMPSHGGGHVGMSMRF